MRVCFVARPTQDYSIGPAKARAERLHSKPEIDRRSGDRSGAGVQSITGAIIAVLFSPRPTWKDPWMTTPTVRLHRWDEIALEKVTEMISRKIVTGDREMVAQIYLKKGALVPMHSHESEQMTYVLQGAMKFLVGGEEITLREGEVLHIPSWVEHQAEALDDTFELDVFSPIRQDWLDHTDTYFHK
jgi:quercetin dioxygenase-like cupin family protein